MSVHCNLSFNGLILYSILGVVGMAPLAGSCKCVWQAHAVYKRAATCEWRLQGQVCSRKCRLMTGIDDVGGGGKGSRGGLGSRGGSRGVWGGGGAWVKCR